MISGHNLNYSYGEKPLYENASFTVGDGMKVGLVGPNGAGKSTLFSLILQQKEPDTGTITVVGQIGYVPQEVRHDPQLEAAATIGDYLDPSHKHPIFQIQTLLNGLELPGISLTAKAHNLSGGQKTKLALARALLQEPDILLLDEPTNFMDVQGKQWVMNLLSEYPKTLILISHDLSLMDKTIDKILALNTHTKKIDEYTGNYSQYQALKKEADALLKRQVVTEQKHIKQLKKGLIKMDRFSSEKGVRQKMNLKRRIARLQQELPELPPEVQTIRFRLPPAGWVGELPIMAKHISKTYGTTSVLQDVSLSLRRGTRTALIGQNGAGKSTLIKILVGLLPPDTGEIYRDEKLNIGYYSQEFETFDLDQTIMEVVRKTNQPDSMLRPLLARFLFTGNKVFQTIHTLSGSEKTRLAIALLLLKNHNILILDEPTTYLDVMSQRVILEALKSYSGTLLIVSHTPEFIAKLQPTQAMLLPENRVVQWTAELIERIGE